MLYKHNPLYSRWRQIKKRCHNENRPDYKHYGGRGIVLCDRWHEFATSAKDVESTIGLPNDGMELDRIDNNKDYEPGNVRWASRKSNCRNKRNYRTLTLDGRTQTVTEWAEEYGVSSAAVFGRLNRGWTLKDALTKSPSIKPFYISKHQSGYQLSIRDETGKRRYVALFRTKPEAEDAGKRLTA